MNTTATPESPDLLADQPAEPATKIVEYSATTAALAELRQRMATVVYDVTSNKGLDAAKRDRRELVSLRTSLELKRKEITAPALERTRLIKSEADRIEAAIKALEEPIDKQIKAEEARREAEKEAKAAAERQRVAAIHAKIDGFRRAVSDATGKTSAEIAALRNTLAATRCDEAWPAQFEEFAADAKGARDSAVIGLADLQDRVARQEAEAAQIEADRKELAELKRLEDERKKREAQAQAAEAARVAAERAEADRLAAVERERLAAIAKQEREEAEQAAAAERAEKLASLQAELDALAAERAELQRQKRLAREAEEAREHAERARLDALAREEQARQDAEREAAAAHQAIMAVAMTASAATPPRTPDAPPAVEVINAVAERFDVTFGAAASWVLDIDRAEVERLMVVSDEQFEVAA